MSGVFTALFISKQLAHPLSLSLAGHGRAHCAGTLPANVSADLAKAASDRRTRALLLIATRQCTRTRNGLIFMGRNLTLFNVALILPFVNHSTVMWL